VQRFGEPQYQRSRGAEKLGVAIAARRRGFLFRRPLWAIGATRSQVPGIEALKPRPNGGRKHENMTLAEEEALLARFAKAAGAGEMLKHPRSQGGLRESDRT
jgi:hypothetical protein